MLDLGQDLVVIGLESDFLIRYLTVNFIYIDSI